MATADKNVQSTLDTYLQHVGRPRLLDALNSFWSAKLADGTYRHRYARKLAALQRSAKVVGSKQNKVDLNSNSNNQATLNGENLVTYELEKVHVGAEQRFIAYAFLPGGSCFGSRESKKSDQEAREAAGRIALYDSLTNEHPYKIVTQTFIAQSLAVAQQGKGPLDSVETYRLILERNLGRSIMELHEFLCPFRLLSWAGVIDRLRTTGVKDEQIVAEYTNSVLDGYFRENLCLSWVSRLEQDAEASVKLYSEFLKCEAELHDARHKQVELRYEKEKREIIRLAYSQLTQNETIGRGMLYATDFAVV